MQVVLYILSLSWWCIHLLLQRDTTSCLLLRGRNSSKKRSIFSSPEPKAPGELIGWEGSVVRRPSVRPSVVRRPSTISNDFSSETTGPIATKFHIQPPGPLGKKSCSNGLGHMTNMAAMPIYGKNLKNLLLQNH